MTISMSVNVTLDAVLARVAVPGWVPISTSGYVPWPPGSSRSTSTFTAANTPMLVPFGAAISGTINDIAVELTTGVAGSGLRIGIFNAVTSQLLGDFGTASGTAPAGARSPVGGVASVNVEAGTAYLLCAVQQTPTTLATWRRGAGGVMPIYGSLAAHIGATPMSCYTTADVIPGALPASIGPITGVQGLSPLFFIDGVPL